MAVGQVVRRDYSAARRRARCVHAWTVTAWFNAYGFYDVVGAVACRRCGAHVALLYSVEKFGKGLEAPEASNLL